MVEPVKRYFKMSYPRQFKFGAWHSSLFDEKDELIYEAMDFFPKWVYEKITDWVKFYSETNQVDVHLQVEPKP